MFQVQTVEPVDTKACVNGWNDFYCGTWFLLITTLHYKKLEAEMNEKDFSDLVPWNLRTEIARSFRLHWQSKGFAHHRFLLLFQWFRKLQRYATGRWSRTHLQIVSELFKKDAELKLMTLVTFAVLRSDCSHSTAVTYSVLRAVFSRCVNGLIFNNVMCFLT